MSMAAGENPSSLPEFIKSTESGRTSLEELREVCTSRCQDESRKQTDSSWMSTVRKLITDLCQPYCKTVLLVSSTLPLPPTSGGDAASTTAPGVQLVVVVAARDVDAFETALVPNSLFKTTYVEPWLQVFEVAHYLDEVMRCSLRLLEALLQFDKVDIYRCELLETLRSQLAWSDFASKDFFNRSLGQLEALVIGRQKDAKQADKEVSGKSGNGDVVLLPGTTEHRLFTYADLVLHKKLSAEHIQVEIAKEVTITNIQQTLKQMRSDFQKAEGIEKRVSDHVRESCLGTLECVRLDGLQVTQPVEVSGDAIERAEALLCPHGSHMSQVPAARLLFLSITGSKLYRLNVAGSDDDFLGVYACTTKEFVRDYNQVKRKTVLDNRGKKLDSGDIALYEASKFAEALMHGGVEVIQMLFTDELLYESKLFQFLRTNRMKLLSEKVIQNYCGYIDKHFDFLLKPQKTPSKVFYHIYHKLGELERLCRGEGPKVQLDGEEREFILRIRRGPMEGEFSYDTLLMRAHERFDEIRDRLAARSTLFPPLADVRVIQEWLLGLYGIPLEVLSAEPLRVVAYAED